MKNDPARTAQSWNDCLASFPAPHLLQSWQWGEFKAISGWQAYRFAWLRHSDGRVEAVPFSPAVVQNGQVAAVAQLLVRRARLGPLPLPFGVAYVPKGPVLDWLDHSVWPAVLADLARLSTRLGAVFLKIDPDIRIGLGVPGEPDSADDFTGLEVESQIASHGWLFSQDQIQFRNTFLLDLAQAEETLLAQMKQKTRYNIRLSERKGVVVRKGISTDLPGIYRMYAETALRDGFAIREEGYYLALWRMFLAGGLLQPLVAEVGGEPVGAVMIFRFGAAAYYMHGMSRDLHRNLMPAYLLQWEAIRWAKTSGCQVYDLWGAPNEFDESDPMYGVYRFKQGLGAQLTRHIGAWDYPIRPRAYRLYTQVLPRILDWMRAFGNARTRRLVEG